MKKILAILLVAAMLSCCAAVSAENASVKTHLGSLNVNGAFDLRCTVPDHYELSVAQADTTQILAFIETEDEAKPIMMLSIAFDELLSGVDRLNDLDDAALAQLEATFEAEDDVEITYGYTDHGTKLLMARFNNEYVDFYTIYKGFAIEFLLTAGEEPLNDDQINMVIGFLSDLDFVEAQ